MKARQINHLTTLGYCFLVFQTHEVYRIPDVKASQSFTILSTSQTEKALARAAARGSRLSRQVVFCFPEGCGMRISVDRAVEFRQAAFSWGDLPY